jgi:hypothetical protein
MHFQLKLIEMNADHSGFIFQITVNIQAGTTFGHRKGGRLSRRSSADCGLFS